MDTITRDRLIKIKKIYSHASCGDGITAAMICAAAYRQTPYGIPDIKLIQYDTKDHNELEPEHGVMFVDMTPCKDGWERWKEFEPIVLDHHATTKHVVEGLNGIYGNETESGATLAFRHVMQQLVESSWIPAGNWERIAHLVSIRDTWQAHHPDWRQAHEISQGMQLYSSKELIERARQGTVPFDDFYKFGDILYTKMMKKAEVLADSAYIQTVIIKGRELKIGYFNCTEKIISEACHVLLEEKNCDIAVSYFIAYMDGQHHTIISLRSKEIPINEVAKLYKGGGHPKAAGFRVKSDLYPLGYIISDLHKGLNQIL